MSNPQHEPTMEEILASIRKIISEDSTAEPPAAAAQRPAAVTAAASDEAEDVLELTEVFAEEPAPAPAPRQEAASAPVSIKPDEIIFQSIEEPQMSEPVYARPEPARTEEPSSAGDIFSDKTRKALDDAFASIEQEEAETPARRSPPDPVAPLDGASIEALFDRAVRETFDPVLRGWLGEHADVIVERMKPVIREWLDQNFPPMLEEAVRNEVARVAKARRR